MNASRISCRTQAKASLWRRLALAFALIALTAGVSQAATTVAAWGNDSDSQSTVPPSLTTGIAIAGGNLHSLALKSDHTVVGWGFNVFGQATPPAGLTNVVAISAGNSYSIALKSNGTVTQWGTQTAPPAGLTNVAAIAAGWTHTLALKSNGTIVVWGTTNVAPTGLTNVLAIAAGNGQSLALLSDSTVVAWGDNTLGQTNVPAGLTNVAAIAAGKNHCLALRWDGTVVAWGNNSSGQTNVPIDLNNVVAIAGGGAHSLALKTDGSLAAWGDNTYGQASVNPAQNGFIAIAGGGTHSLSIRNDGSPVVLASPQNETATISKNASFQVLFVGAQPISVQWRHYGTNLPGANSSTLMLTNIQSADSGPYTAVISNFFATITSAPATLNAVGAVPFFTLQPQDTTNFCGDGAFFTAAADGSSPFGYQWLFEGEPIDSATDTNLTLVNISEDDEGEYSLVVTNAYGSTTSAVAFLTVAIEPPYITSPLSVTGRQGRGFGYLITAIHTPTSYDASGLPPGLSFDPVNGVISGTPTESGTFGPLITAYNNCDSDTEVLLLTITSSAPVITSSLTANGTEQSSFFYVIRAANNPTGFGADGLPAGLTVNPANGVISGTPIFGGDFYSTITASNQWGIGSATLHFSFGYENIAGLSITNVTATYSSPYILDFQFTLKDNNDPTMGNVLAVDPSQLTAAGFENGLPLSSESDVIIARASPITQLGPKLIKSYLVLDFSESMASIPDNGDSNNNGISDALDAIVAGAQIFVNEQPADSQIGVYEFHADNVYPSNVVALTTDRTKLDNAIGGIWTNQVSGGFTSGSRLWDAALAAITNMPAAKSDEQHSIILATDGMDTSSFVTTNDVITAAIAAGVNIYCIGFGTPDVNTLQAVSAATGGQYYDSASGLAFDNVVRDLGGQYLLRWATLKRSPTPFLPSFQISYHNFTVPSPPPFVDGTNYITNSMTMVVTTNYHTNYSPIPFYTPTAHTGNVTVGTLRLLPNSNVFPQTVTLRTPYVPRNIRQISIHYRPNWPCKPSLLSTNVGEMLYGWSLSETNDGAGGRWLELLSPNSQYLSNSIPFADLGTLVQFSLRDMVNSSNAFSFFVPDNTIYTNTGGQSFLMDTNTPSFITNYPPMPFGTPVPWLISYFPSGSGSNFWASNSIADPDHDGVPTWLEFIEGTNPTNASSKFVMRGITRSPLDLRYSAIFSTATNRTYRLESSSNLLDWEPVLDNIQGIGADITINDTRYVPSSAIFYRAVVY
ncbi:MAG: large repetitive protein [Verrucomicrobiota bacterium]